MVEVAAAIAFGSLALLADGVHMVSDVAALAIALVAQQLATRRASSKHTYGLVRAEVIGAQVNAILLLGAAAYIVIEAVGRIDDPGTIDGAGVMVIAAAGLVVNVGSAWVIAPDRRRRTSTSVVPSGTSSATRWVRSARWSRVRRSCCSAPTGSIP